MQEVQQTNFFSSNEKSFAKNSMQKTAMFFISRGFRVFPVYPVINKKCACYDTDCSTPGRHPMICNWKENGTNDVRQICSWWTRWKDAWIGVVLTEGATDWVLISSALISANPNAILWTSWPSLTETKGSLCLSWPPFSEKMHTPILVDEKQKLPGFSLGIFQSNRRNKANVFMMTGIAFDYDGESISPQIGCKALLPYQGVLYTTFRHKESSPRWRLLLPFSRPVFPEEYQIIWQRLRDKLFCKSIAVDESCKDTSRLWFAPGVSPEHKRDFVFCSFGSILLDPESFLSEKSAKKQFSISEKSKDNAVSIQNREDTKKDTLVQTENTHATVQLRRAIDKIQHAKEGERNTTLRDWACLIGGFLSDPRWGLDAREVEMKLLQAALSSGLALSESKKTLQNALSYGKKQPISFEKETVANDTKKRKTVATELRDLAIEAGIDLWSSDKDSGERYATIPVGSHREHYRLQSSAIEEWLYDLYEENKGGVPSAQAINDAMRALAARARRAKKRYPAYLRTGYLDEKFYLDLGNSDWSAIEIDKHGWRKVAQPAVRFWHPREMLPLPEPKHDGSIFDLRDLINAPGEEEWILMVSWLVFALQPKGPYPVLVLQGEQGTAKSTTSRVLRSIIDPNKVMLAGPPKDEDAIAADAHSNWTLGYDNLSGVSRWLSDTFCRLANGGGFSRRKLYTNFERAAFEAMRPLLLNGIDDVTTRGDLADRALLVNLPRIKDDTRLPEDVFYSELRKRAPSILGGLLNALSEGIRNLPSVKLDTLPRMADFAKWVVACEPALPWRPGRFWEIYQNARTHALQISLEEEPFADMIKTLARQKGGFHGTAAELLSILNETAEHTVKNQRKWPKSPREMAEKIRRIADALRASGFLLESHKRTKHGKLYSISFQKREEVLKP